jgi:hypothetical protein
MTELLIENVGAYRKLGFESIGGAIRHGPDAI